MRKNEDSVKLLLFFTADKVINIFMLSIAPLTAA